MSQTGRMTKGEREDLLRLIKQRERVAKSGAEQRSAVLLAEFEQQISAVYAFDQDSVWRQAYEAAAAAFAKANAEIAARSAELGIPEPFQPQLHMAWARRGENELKQRRDELRRVAKAEIAALEQTARVQIETESIRAQTEVVSTGLSSEAAVAFLERLPAVETLMPTLELASIEHKAAQKQARAAVGFREYG